MGGLFGGAWKWWYNGIGVWREEDYIDMMEKKVRNLMQKRGRTGDVFN
jgi:hypothetical protein